MQWPEIKKERSEALLARVETWSREFVGEQANTPAKVLLEEYVSEGGKRFLAGYNESYVRYGVPKEEAKRLGLEPGMLTDTGDACVI